MTVIGCDKCNWRPGQPCRCTRNSTEVVGDDYAIKREFNHITTVIKINKSAKIINNADMPHVAD